VALENPLMTAARSAEVLRRRELSQPLALFFFFFFKGQKHEPPMALGRPRDGAARLGA